MRSILILWFRDPRWFYDFEIHVDYMNIYPISYIQYGNIPIRDSPPPHPTPCWGRPQTGPGGGHGVGWGDINIHIDININIDINIIINMNIYYLLSIIYYPLPLIYPGHFWWHFRSNFDYLLFLFSIGDFWLFRRKSKRHLSPAEANSFSSIKPSSLTSADANKAAAYKQQAIGKK